MKYGRIISYDVGNGEGVRASLFVSGSFEKLSIEYSANVVLDTLVFISTESETRKERIIEEIKNPTKK